MELRATRDGFGEELVTVAEKDERVMALAADLTESLRLVEFERRFPERFIQCGVAEQNMVGVAVGLALTGKIPFAGSFGVFSPGLNWGVIRQSVCYNKANVKLVGSHGGIGVAEDGASHQALEDVAIMRVLPAMTVVVPADYYQTKQAVRALAKHRGPAYLRLTRQKSAVFIKKEIEFKLGRAQLLRSGTQVSLIGCGPVVYELLETAERLKGEIDIEVINCHTVKPLDKETIIKSANKTGLVVTAEDHQIIGGLGGAVAEVMAERGTGARLQRLGVHDRFGESGRTEQLEELFGLTADKIIGVVKKIVDQEAKLKTQISNVKTTTQI